MQRSKRGKKGAWRVNSFLVSPLVVFSLASTLVLPLCKAWMIPRSRNQSPSPPLQAWSRHVWIETTGGTDTDPTGMVDEKARIRTEECLSNQEGFNLASSRGWLEYLPDGAYTVLRCDCLRSQWTVWGREFHLNRLAESLESMATQSDATLSKGEGVFLKKNTEQLLETLLSMAEKEVASSNRNTSDSFLSDAFMITFLWYRQPEKSFYSVRGHILQMPRQNPWKYDPDPISAAVALIMDNHHNCLPNRMLAPHAKLSSWCRCRRPLEEKFKQSHVGEVLLVSNTEGNSCQLLEGLTSNLFILYRDGTLRTAATQVLHGYARQMVLESANRMSLTVDLSTPIDLSEHNQWQEIFVTSAAKLLVPVHEVFVPLEEEGHDQSDIRSMKLLWSQKSQNDTLWQALYEDIVSQQLGRMS